jgi:hypothetical protein
VADACLPSTASGLASARTGPKGYDPSVTPGLGLNSLLLFRLRKTRMLWRNSLAKARVREKSHLAQWLG